MRIRKKGTLLLLCLFTSLAAAGLIISGPPITNGASEDAEFRGQVRNAIAELAFPASADALAIDTARTNLAEFLSYRSGVLVSDAQLEELGVAEQLAQESGGRISKSDLTEILAEIALRKLAKLTEDQKVIVVESLRGFDAPDLPDSFKRGRDKVSLRASGEGRMSVKVFRTKLDSVSGSSAESKIVRTLVRKSLAFEIERVCSGLLEADRNFFSASKCEMTPLQAVLIAYAVVTDDDLAGNRADLALRMEGIRSFIERKFGVDFPAPESYTAFGRNGYIYSTPADLILDSYSMDLLVRKIRERLNQ